MANAEVVPTEAVQTESKPVAPKEQWIFTNHTDTQVVIQDLGYGAPGGQFSAESFKPGETKNLAERYSLRELRRSHSLRIAVDDMKCLTRGSKADAPAEHPLSRLAKQNKNMEGAWQDPTRNIFDDKMDELKEKEKAEDERTKPHT